jgi:hypothetical protein
MKNFFLPLFIILILFSVSPVSAQEFVPLAGIPGLTGAEGVATEEGLPQFFNNLYTFLIGLAAVLAVIQIIRSGIEIAANQGNVSDIISAKGRVAQAIFGLILVLSPALVFSVINPNILNLSVSLPPIEFSVLQHTGTPDEETLCDIRRSGDLFVGAICPPHVGEGGYVCPSGLTKRASVCPADAFGLCSIEITCSRDVVVVYHNPPGVNFTDVIVPSYRETYDAFVSGCAEIGGKLETDSGILAPFRFTPENCPSGFDPGNGGSCYNVRLSCTP